MLVGAAVLPAVLLFWSAGQNAHAQEAFDACADVEGVHVTNKDATNLGDTTMRQPVCLPYYLNTSDAILAPETMSGTKCPTTGTSASCSVYRITPNRCL